MSVSYGMPSPPQACGTRYVVALRLCFTKIDINLRKRDILHVKKSKTHNITVSHTLFTVTMDKITIQSRRFYRPVKAFRHQEKRIQATEKGVPCRKRPAVHSSHRTVTEMVLSPLTRKKKPSGTVLRFLLLHLYNLPDRRKRRNEQSVILTTDRNEN